MLGKYDTVVHPSVFFIFDVYGKIAEHTKVKKDQQGTSEFRANDMVEDQELPCFLDEGLSEWLANSEVKAFRILVIGMTGVGKLTLFNRVFGIDQMVSLSNRQGWWRMLIEQTLGSDGLN